MIRIFFSWQSDVSQAATTRAIRSAIAHAAAAMTKKYNMPVVPDEATRDVTIDGGQPTGVGGVIGAVVGGVGGSYIGSGHGTIIGSVVGSVLGGLAGNAAERAGSRKPGVELTISLDEGHTIVVVQSVAEELFKTGDRVRVISDGATARVSK